MKKTMKISKIILSIALLLGLANQTCMADLTNNISCPTAVTTLDCTEALKQCETSNCTAGQNIICSTTPTNCSADCPATQITCQKALCGTDVLTCNTQTNCTINGNMLKGNPILFTTSNPLDKTQMDKIQVDLISLTPGSCLSFRQKKANDLISITLEYNFGSKNNPLYMASEGFTIEAAESSANTALYKIIDDTRTSIRQETFHVECPTSSCSIMLTGVCYRHSIDGKTDPQKVSCSETVTFNLFECSTRATCPLTLHHASVTTGQYPSFPDHLVIRPGSLPAGRCIRLRPQATDMVTLQISDTQFEDLKTSTGSSIIRPTIINAASAASLWGNYIAIHPVAPGINECIMSGANTTQTVALTDTGTLTIRCHKEDAQVNCSTALYTDLVSCEPTQQVTPQTVKRPVTCESAHQDCPTNCKDCPPGEQLLCTEECISSCLSCPTYCP